jgi:hypothetical protein
MKTPDVKPRSMAPREHGAWGQLLTPLVLALALGRPRAVAFGLAVAVVAVFMAHEPLLVLLGQRGTRAARESGAHARLRLGSMLGVATVVGAAAFVGAEAPVRWAVLISLTALLVAVLAFLVKGQERSVMGELWIAATLPIAAVPVALAAQVEPVRALVTWLSLALAYSTGIVGVRAIILDARTNQPFAGWWALALTWLASVLLLGYNRHAGTAALLYWVAVACCRVARPTPKSLRRVGWILVGASVLQALWILVASRMSG